LVGPDVTGVEEVHVVPLLVKTLPVVPGATNCTADVPLPRRTLLAVRVAAPVPPLVTAKTPVELAPSAKIDRLREIVMTYYSRLALMRL
jgi:hypothetical protein